jgi:hypothetical protein
MARRRQDGGGLSWNAPTVLGHDVIHAGATVAHVLTRPVRTPSVAGRRRNQRFRKRPGHTIDAEIDHEQPLVLRQPRREAQHEGVVSQHGPVDGAGTLLPECLVLSADREQIFIQLTVRRVRISLLPLQLAALEGRRIVWGREQRLRVGSSQTRELR